MSFLEKIMNILGFEKPKGAIATRWRIKRRPSLVPVKSPASPPTNQFPLNQPVEYVMNDPTTTDLIKSIMPPIYTGSHPFTIKNYKGGGYSRTTSEGQSANCYVTITNVLNYYNSKSDIPLPRWAGTSNLNIYPLAGIDVNAYYDRRSLRFFSFADSRVVGVIYTCDSSDIVAHELGHAILDTFRPETWNAALIEVGAFHEAFADFSAIIHAMRYDEMINKALAETNNDLNKPNVINRLAEQFGHAIFKMSGPNSGRTSDCLRSAVNSFVYVEPSTLPNDAPADQLANDPHSFGRIFLGALWDIFIMMYEDNIATEKMTYLLAAQTARDTLTRYVLKSVQNAPVNAKFFQSMATTMLWSDVVVGNRKYHDRMRNIFVKRNIIPSVIKMLSEAPPCPSNSLTLKIYNNMNIKLHDKVIRSQSDNPLYDVFLEVPSEQIYLYDQNRNLYDSILITEEESIKGACEMINHLHACNKVSDHPKTPFEINNGKLVRTFIA